MAIDRGQLGVEIGRGVFRPIRHQPDVADELVLVANLLVALYAGPIPLGQSFEDRHRGEHAIQWQPINRSDLCNSGLCDLVLASLAAASTGAFAPMIRTVTHVEK